jgi:hypothetical protein
VEASGTPASSPAPLDSLPFIAYRGPLSGLLAKVESGEFVPKLQASHAPPCKFWTAFAVINGIRHMVPIIHGPSGCTYSAAADYKMYACEYRGVPFEPTTCTLLDETNIVYGGEGKLRAALAEAVGKYHSDLIVVLSCCCSGIIGDDVEAVAAQAQEELGVRIIAIRSEGFGGDFRSGHEDAFKVIMKLMDPPKPGERLKGTINLVGARGGPTYAERPQDIKELERLCDLMWVRLTWPSPAAAPWRRFGERYCCCRMLSSGKQLRVATGSTYATKANTRRPRRPGPGRAGTPRAMDV